MTMRKLKNVLPATKPKIDKMLRSGVVYKLTCPRCAACYVGQTSRHLQTRFREHINNQGPIKHHLTLCKVKMNEENVDILSQTSRGEQYLLTLEALWINNIKPEINTKDEYRNKTLTIKM